MYDMEIYSWRRKRYIINQSPDNANQRCIDMSNAPYSKRKDYTRRKKVLTEQAKHLVHLQRISSALSISRCGILGSAESSASNMAHLSADGPSQYLREPR